MYILTLNNVTKNEFVNFWSNNYNYGYEEIYHTLITSSTNRSYTESEVLNLFTWKNGRNLSDKKNKSVWNNYINDDTVYPEIPSLDFVKKQLLKPGGTIWRIFWLHCKYPNEFPIYDQHVHRAMAKIKGYNNLEIPKYNANKVDIYINEYLDFYNEFEGINKKRVDEALWAFGKFLSLGYKV